MKTKLLILSLILLCSLSNMMAKPWEKIRIGVTDSYPPFSMLDADGKLTGFDIDIAHALCESMYAQCTFVVLNLNYNHLRQALLEEKVDVIIASVAITEKRKKKVAFTNKYYYTPVGWVAKKGEFNQINYGILAAKYIGVLDGTIFEDYINEKYAKNSKVRKYKKIDEMYLAIKTGEIDVFIADVLQVTNFFLNSDAGKNYEFVDNFISAKKFFGEGAGIVTRKENHDLLQFINEAIIQIRNNGEYNLIRKKYFNYDIYGN